MVGGQYLKDFLDELSDWLRKLKKYQFLHPIQFFASCPVPLANLHVRGIFLLPLPMKFSDFA